jgi:hypothetical protein
MVALVGRGAVVVFGMMTMSGNAPTEAPVNRDGTYGQEGAQAPSSYGKAPMAAQDGATAAKAAVPEFITVNGFVYSLSGSEDTSASSLTRLSTTTSSLALNGQAVQRTGYAGPSSDTVYVVDSDERVLAFARVTREYQGQTYVLFSSEITAFGQWPSLPSGLAVPTSPDGSPTFVTGGDDASGVQTYRPAIAQGADGIAIAPSTDTGLMQGNPNWTWWTVAR